MLTISKASAGAGKTFLLTKTYIDMLFSAHHAKNAHRCILAVTFTKKATAEMKKRIVEELSLLARAEESDFAAGLLQDYSLTPQQLQEQAQQILFDLLQDYGAFAVSTIDSFFQQVIRSFSRELGLAGKYNLELDTKTIQQTAVDDFFFSLSPTADKHTFDALLSIIEDNLEGEHGWDPKNDILNLSAELFKERVMLHKQTLFAYLKNTQAVEAYKTQQYVIRQNYLTAYRAAAKKVKDYFAANNLEYATFSNGNDVFSPLDYDFSKILAKIDSPPARFIKFAEGRASCLKKADQSKPAMQMHEAELFRLVQPLYDSLTGEPARQLLTAEAILKKYSILLLLEKIAACIEAKNKDLNRLPISETNALLNAVVEANATSPFIYEKIGTRIRHFLIDEFQDTSAMQWTSFRPLIQESLATNQANLVVGDVKQSIYRFRNSDYSLMLRGITKDFPLHISNPLAGNWRSARSVVNFNNAFFAELSFSLNAEMNGVFADDEHHPLYGVIQEVYAQHEQNPMLAAKAEKKGENVEEGFVQIQFSPCKKKADWRDNVLEQLPALLADLQKRQFPLGRVACLIRNNKDALMIAETLIGAGYKVMSNEGLKLIASPAVMFVILSLKQQVYPDDPIIRYERTYFAELIHVPLVTAEAEQLLSQDTSLSAHVQAIIRTYSLDTLDAHKAYLLALQDVVYDYQNRFQSDLYSFLTWWDEHAASFSLNMQETQDAIQLVSIHKSKGLEYDVVIIPFCDWAKSTDVNSRKNILWVESPEAKSGQASSIAPPLLPIGFNKQLAQSAFVEDYNQELLDLYLDNLNLTYVAFTRTTKEMYIFAPALQANEKSDNMGTQLHAILRHHACGMELKEENDISTYTVGERAIYIPKKAKAKQQDTPTKNPWAVTLPILSTPIAEKKGESPEGGESDNKEEKKRLGLCLHAPAYFSTENDAQTLGVLVHQILQQVNVRGDEEQVIAEMLRQGLLQQSQLPIIKTRMQQFWELIGREGRSDWFDATRYTILNEQDILLTTGRTERPDRILIDSRNQHAVIIDYKTGREHKQKYEKQVQGYMQYLQQMGYTVEGYLCYISIGKIAPVVFKA